ncbi:concanavalin A-like lectin/glucanase superfamily protein [Stackebrandtia endophytica]|uniref:Concanavalin A-like lectin/glucanase superfamily protein n=1 Tax=Stackebrandtia endophytica TaxID=1496996 RepID=A0A543B170_9ACTN|nr:LamG-like jellyroll fold domain-containing protein [Stackebrandtia endophytica]TQL78536.1 concanavalin A-like lectin/glucanase superfamily protein [Stackebrandtia endophytica]
MAAARRRICALAVSAGLAVTLIQPESFPLNGSATTDDECASPATHLEFESEAVALATACGVPVEISSAGSPDTEVFAEPDGQVRVSSYVEPIRARLDSGEWAPIDTTLSTHSSGRIIPANTVFPVSFSPGGDAALAVGDNADGRFALSWPDPLPEPSLTGDTATYPEVLPGVDLTVTATAAGFSHALVVKDATAADNPRLAEIRFGLQTDGVTARLSESGGIDLLDAAGEQVWTTPTPQMWDSPESTSGESEEPQRRVADIGVTLESDALVLHPDVDLFDGAVYPVIIDPLWNGGGLRSGEWTTVWSKYPTTSFWKRADTGGNDKTFGAAKVGRVCNYDTNGNCLTSTYVVRSLFRMNTEGVQGKQITSATFKILQKHAWQCSPKTKAKVWRTELVKSSHTWNNQPTWTSETATSHDYANYRAGCGTQGLVEFDVTPMVVKSAANNWMSITLGMKAMDESTTAQWKRYDHSTAKIDIYYNSVPGTPTDLALNGTACITDWTDGGLWFDDARPEFAGKVTDADGTVRARVQLWALESGATDHHVVYDQTSGNLTSGAIYRWRPPADLDQLRNYWWRMQATDGQASGPWTQWCYFQVDTTPPAAPELDRVGDPPLAGDDVRINLRGPSSDTVSFSYGLNRDTPDQTVTAVDGTASITWNNLPQGPNLLYVWARDRAGNLSQRAVIQVFGGRILDPQPQGVWRFAGDTRDDSFGEHDITGDVDYTVDQQGRAGGALALNGSSCLSTEKSVLRTDGPFTVTSWVRLNQTTTDQMVLSQVGDQRGAFELYFESATKSWVLAAPGVDEWTPDLSDWSRAVSAEEATADSWTHLAAAVDPVAQIMRLYVNGQMAGEAALPFSTWRATGPLTIGCVTGQEHGLTWHHFDGAIAATSAWHGLMSGDQIEAAAVELPLGVTGSWALRSETGGTDASRHERGFTMPPSASYVADSSGRTGSAWQARGESCAVTDNTVIRTDDSFTVATWAKLDTTGTDAVLLSQDAATDSSVRLGFDAASGGWALWLRSADGTRKLTSSPVDLGEWTHLVAVYDDATGTAALYVNGELAADAATARPEAATGPLRLGCALTAGSEAAHWPGAISHLVTWRGAADAGQAAWIHGGNPSVKELSMWALEGDGADSWGTTEMTLVGDYEWVEDRVGWPGSALGLQMDGTGYGHTDAAVADTTDSFTVSSWVKLDDLGRDQTVVAQAAGSEAAFTLAYDATAARWVFRMPSGSTVAEVRSSAAPTVGQWVHLTATFDRAAATMRLYVDGVAQGESAAPASPHHSTGPTLLGASGDTSGATWDLLIGAVDDVRIWRGVVHPDRIRDLAVA